jgi:hypothetical protein
MLLLSTPSFALDLDGSGVSDAYEYYFLGQGNLAGADLSIDADEDGWPLSTEIVFGMDPLDNLSLTRPLPPTLGLARFDGHLGGGGVE